MNVDLNEEKAKTEEGSSPSIALSIGARFSQSSDRPSSL